jgi:hypothetical protein
MYMAELLLLTVTTGELGVRCTKSSAGLPLRMMRLGGVATKSISGTSTDACLVGGQWLTPAAAVTAVSTMLSGSFLLLMFMIVLHFCFRASYLTTQWLYRWCCPLVIIVIDFSETAAHCVRCEFDLIHFQSALVIFMPLV